VVVVGGRNQQMKGNRHLRYPKGTPLANLAFGLIEEFGVNVERFGDSTGELELLWRLTGSRIDWHQERKDRRPQRMGASSWERRAVTDRAGRAVALRSD